MNKALLLLFILITALSSCEQKVKNSPDNEYFLPGTLSDYMGREKYQQVKGRVEVLVLKKL